MWRASVSFLTELVDLIDIVSFCWPFWLPTVKAEKQAETGPLKRADDTDLDDSAAWQVALLTLQKLCRLERVSALQTVWNALVQGPKRLAAMAQLGRMIAERDTLEALQENLQKALSVAAELLHDAVRGTSRQQHELVGRYSQIARLLPSTSSIPAGRRVARTPSGTNEVHPPPLESKRPS